MSAKLPENAELNATNALPPVLLGPVLRRMDECRVVMMLVTTQPSALRLWLWPAQDGTVPLSRDTAQQHDLTEAITTIALGRHAWLQLIDLTLPEPLPAGQAIAYDVGVAPIGTSASRDWPGIASWAPHLLQPGRQLPCFVLQKRLQRLWFGSCRKPHAPAPDGLAHVDALLDDVSRQPAIAPSALLLTGDQVYADDVAGPMLAAIHALITRLGLFDERLAGADVADSQAVHGEDAHYYRREGLLPAVAANRDLRERFFGGAEKPVFTTASAHNHLVTLAEMLAMYLLVWSPVPWRLIAPRKPDLAPQFATRYEVEDRCLRHFVERLPQAARVLAHVPTLMIFDDHDITDDWNLSARWELTAYGHPFSRRIIGNALIAYAWMQGWGNRPEAFRQLVPAWTAMSDTAAKEGGWWPTKTQDAMISALLRFDQWHYDLDASPGLMVLDTRTHRWRSERQLSRPSGLMDWEALSDLQQWMLDRPAAVIVSPAPMFGVKLIEVLQRVMTWLGLALMVDAENWMAHRGAARTMMNIFRHSRTPANYVVLSGDVHYSFVYQIRLREHTEGAPHLWQITSSGLKNEFPRRLLDWLDRLNRWLYAPHSPLNWLTKRRDLVPTPWLPDRRKAGERLWNGAGFGEVWLDEQGRPTRVLHHNADGSGPTRFEASR